MQSLDYSNSVHIHFDNANIFLIQNTISYQRVRVMVFNITFNNRSVVLVEETGVPRENQNTKLQIYHIAMVLTFQTILPESFLITSNQDIFFFAMVFQRSRNHAVMQQCPNYYSSGDIDYLLTNKLYVMFQCILYFLKMLCTIISKPLSKSKYRDETVATSNLMIQNMKILWIQHRNVQKWTYFATRNPNCKEKEGTNVYYSTSDKLSEN